MTGSTVEFCHNTFDIPPNTHYNWHPCAPSVHYIDLTHCDLVHVLPYGDIYMYLDQNWLR